MDEVSIFLAADSLTDALRAHLRGWMTGPPTIHRSSTLLGRQTRKRAFIQCYRAA